MTRLKTRGLPWGHIVVWLIVFAYISFDHYGDMPKFGPLQWCWYAWCLASPAALFYTVAYFAGRFFARHYRALLFAGGLGEQLRILSKQYVVAVLLAAVTHLAVATLLENSIPGAAPKIDRYLPPGKVPVPLGPGSETALERHGTLLYTAAAVLYALVRSTKVPLPGNGNGQGENGDSGGGDGGTPLIRHRTFGPYRKKEKA